MSIHIQYNIPMYQQHNKYKIKFLFRLEIQITYQPIFFLTRRLETRDETFHRPQTVVHRRHIALFRCLLCSLQRRCCVPFLVIFNTSLSTTIWKLKTLQNTFPAQFSKKKKICWRKLTPTQLDWLTDSKPRTLSINTVQHYIYIFIFIFNNTILIDIQDPQI